jgi:hypothetical protein
MQAWLKKPGPSHAVAYYVNDDDLIQSICRFMDSGLKAGDSCRVIISDRLRDKLEHALAATLGTSVSQLHIASAETALESVMGKDMPDKQKVFRIFRQLMATEVGPNQALRIYGDASPLLWNMGNWRAAIKLEQWAEELAHAHPISFYCAYPVNLFADNSAYGLKLINGHHTLHGMLGALPKSSKA